MPMPRADVEAPEAPRGDSVYSDDLGCDAVHVTDPAGLTEGARLGRQAAEHLVYRWPETADVTELATEEFSAAAVERLAELIEDEPPLFQASRLGSERGAESLSARPFQGIMESVQNADDLGATELRVALRVCGQRHELLIAHNGAPISLRHVGAMVLPWVSTKIDDPDASGRFGIGQKTLRALGGPIAAHCRPYHFRMDDTPRACPSEPLIPGVYDPAERETLLVVPLNAEVDTRELSQFLADLGTRALVFLRSIRRLALIDLESGTAIVDHRLRERRRRTIELNVQGRDVQGEVVELTDHLRRQTYWRCMVEVPLKEDERRHNKATGPTTTLGVCVPRQPEQGLLYDRVPLPVRSSLQVGLNAQFDPDTARSTLNENPWNARRFAELGDLLAGVALDLFTRDARRAWGTVPLLHEVPEGAGPWLLERYLVDVIGCCHLRLAKEVHLRIKEMRRTLDEIVFEDASLERVLTDSDQERLAPGMSSVPRGQRDQLGRWRSVLQELGRSQRLDLTDALRLFDREDADLGEREPSWYVAFADAAIEADALGSFCARRSILLASGDRVVPPGREEPRSLVVRDKPRSLASRLGLTLPIHSAYTAAGRVALRVRGRLREEKWLVDSYESDDEALALLARGRNERIRLDDDALLALRDALERLSEGQQRELGPNIGQAIELRALSYDKNGKAEQGWASPCRAYLPTRIDHETDSFARAAGKTPGIHWLSPDYAEALRRSGGRRELGAQRLLVRLGAQTFPELERPPNEVRPYARDARLVSPIEFGQMPDVQTTEIRALAQRATYLDGDRWSPDLDAVINDIQRDRPPARRRRRAVALVGLLVRGWDRHFSDHAAAHAVWGYDGRWHDRGEVIATWLARAATEPWLPSATGTLRAPRDLHLPSEANRLSVGDKRSLYMMAVDDQLLRSPALAALRIRRGPSATSIVRGLEDLRDSGVSGAAAANQAHTAYRLLALACPPDGGPRPVDDMTVTALRGHFAGGRDAGPNRGLLFIDGRWYAPSQVFGGPRIFGRYRPFVPPSAHLEPLWRTLMIPRPTARDCVAVLRDLATTPLSNDDGIVMIETLRALTTELEEASPQLRASLKSLPIWCGTGWILKRPIYAITDESTASAVAGQAPVWQPGFSIEGMTSVIEGLGLTLIAADEFIPTVDAGLGAAEGEALRTRFVLALDHLRAELARRDHQLYQTLTIAWAQLAAAQLFVDSNLEIVASVPGSAQFVAPASAHLLREPLALFARSAEDLGSAEGGGRSIAQLFTGDRQKVAWAWAAMWQKAEAGLTAQRVVLSSDLAADFGGDDRLERLRTQRDVRHARKGKKAENAASAAKTHRGGAVHVRRLKEIDDLEPSSGSIINRGAQQGGLIIRPRHPTEVTAAGGGSHSTTTAAIPTHQVSEGATQTSASKAASVLPPMSAREQLAYDAVKAALALDDHEVADLRHRRGVGADALDDLRQCYEIKMSSGSEIPSEITFTPSEVERARTDPDFFLAVVAGLEEGAGELRVRFIFDPLNRLPLRVNSALIFGGVRDAEALEYVFPVAGAHAVTPDVVADPSSG